jgi:hypothetical protein
MFRRLLAVCVLLVTPAAALAGARVETSDARVLEGDLVSVSAEQVVLKGADGKVQTVPAGEVMEISWAPVPDLMDKPGQAVLTTVPGDRLALKDLAFEGKALRADSVLLGQVELSLEQASAVYLPESERTAAAVEAQYRELKLPDTAGDRLLVTKEGKVAIGVDGVLEAIDPKMISFRWMDQSRKIARPSVTMIRLASVAAKPPVLKGALLGRDGCRVGFTALTIQAGKAELASPALGKQAIALDKVAAVRFASDRAVDLTELKPSAVKEYGFFGTTFHYRVNRSVAGTPLRLGGQTYRTGLGMHSFCELLIPLGDKYSLLVATVGIDDAARPNGDATVTFLGDGRPLGKPVQVTGKSAPQPVRLKLDGVESLLIRVDFGEDGLDFADHVDLVAARLIK